LNPKEQAVVRAEWTARMTARREALDLATRFAAAGRSWVELDDDGKVVERSAAPSSPAKRVPRTATKATAKATARSGAGAKPKADAKTAATTKPTKATNAAGPTAARKPGRRASGARSTT
jgi:hypothetical protein